MQTKREKVEKIQTATKRTAGWSRRHQDVKEGDREVFLKVRKAMETRSMARRERKKRLM